MKDPYEVLNIPPDASDDQVKKAYRSMAKKYHPDAMHGNPLADLAEERMKEINDAHDRIQKMRKAGSASPNTSYSPGQSQTRTTQQQKTQRQSSNQGQSAYQRQNPYGFHHQGSHHDNPLYNQIRMHIIQGNLTLAAQLLGQLTEKNGEYYYLAGTLAYRKGWIDEATQYYYKAFQMEPNNMEYRQAFEKIQFFKGSRNSNAHMAPSCCNICSCCQPVLCYLCCCL